LALIAILSANLALMNLLPIPVLDGGALLFCLAEVVMRRPLPARVQAAATGLGVAALATMFMLITVHDLDGLGVLRWLTQL
jgi:regulator of sigma E protease